MKKPRFAFMLAILVAVAASSACQSSPKPPLTLADIPVFPGAVLIEIKQNLQAAAADIRIARQYAGMQTIDTRAYTLPSGATAIQVRDFYVERLSRQWMLQERMSVQGGGIIGIYSPEPGYQVLEVNIFAPSSSDPGLLMLTVIYWDHKPK